MIIMKLTPFSKNNENVYMNRQCYTAWRICLCLAAANSSLAADQEAASLEKVIFMWDSSNYFFYKNCPLRIYNAVCVSVCMDLPEMYFRGETKRLSVSRLCSGAGLPGSSWKAKRRQRGSWYIHSYLRFFSLSPEFQYHSYHSFSCCFLREIEISKIWPSPSFPCSTNWLKQLDCQLGLISAQNFTTEIQCRRSKPKKNNCNS